VLLRVQALLVHSPLLLRQEGGGGGVEQSVPAPKAALPPLLRDVSSPAAAAKYHHRQSCCCRTAPQRTHGTHLQDLAPHELLFDAHRPLFVKSIEHAVQRLQRNPDGGGAADKREKLGYGSLQRKEARGGTSARSGEHMECQHAAARGVRGGRAAAAGGGGGSGGASGGAEWQRGTARGDSKNQ
jgi:hypothetical protein